MTMQYVGEVRIMAFTYAPAGWLLCRGQLLLISQYTTLYSLLGIAYGGDGQTTFKVPDLTGRIPVGQGGELSIGTTLGSETVALTGQQMPEHFHPFMADAATAAAQNSNDPTGKLLGRSAGVQNPGGGAYALTAYGKGDPGAQMAPSSVGSVGGQAHENRQPYLPLNYCIAVEGIYPDRQ